MLLTLAFVVLWLKLLQNHLSFAISNVIASLYSNIRLIIFGDILDLQSLVEGRHGGMKIITSDKTLEHMVAGTS